MLNGAERGVKRGAPEELLRTSMSLNFAAKIGALWPRGNVSPIPIISSFSGFPTELVKLQGIQMLQQDAAAPTIQTRARSKDGDVKNEE